MYPEKVNLDTDTDPDPDQDLNKDLNRTMELIRKVSRLPTSHFYEHAFKVLVMTSFKPISGAFLECHGPSFVDKKFTVTFVDFIKIQVCGFICPKFRDRGLLQIGDWFDLFHETHKDRLCWQKNHGRSILIWFRIMFIGNFNYRRNIQNSMTEFSWRWEDLPFI